MLHVFAVDTLYLPSWRDAAALLNPGPHSRVRPFAGASTRCAAPARPALAAFVRPCTASVLANTPAHPLFRPANRLKCRALFGWHGNSNPAPTTFTR